MCKRQVILYGLLILLNVLDSSGWAFGDGEDVSPQLSESERLCGNQADGFSYVLDQNGRELSFECMGGKLHGHYRSYRIKGQHVYLEADYHFRFGVLSGPTWDWTIVDGYFERSFCYYLAGLQDGLCWRLHGEGSSDKLLNIFMYDAGDILYSESYRIYKDSEKEEEIRVLLSRYEYQNRVLHGLYLDREGQIQGTMVNGKKHGVWKFFNKEWYPIDTCLFDHGKLIEYEESDCKEKYSPEMCGAEIFFISCQNIANPPVEKTWSQNFFKGLQRTMSSGFASRGQDRPIYVTFLKRCSGQDNPWNDRCFRALYHSLFKLLEWGLGMP